MPVSEMHCRRLAGLLTAKDITIPAVATLVGNLDALQTWQPAGPTALADLLKNATPSTITGIVDAELSTNRNDVAEVRNGAAEILVRNFAHAVKHGPVADDIVTALQPLAQAAAADLTAAVTAIGGDVDVDAETVLTAGRPEAVTGWNAIPAAVNRLNSIDDILGVLVTDFAVIDDPDPVYTDARPRSFVKAALWFGHAAVDGDDNPGGTLMNAAIDYSTAATAAQNARGRRRVGIWGNGAHLQLRTPSQARAILTTAAADHRAKEQAHLATLRGRLTEDGFVPDNA